MQPLWKIGLQGLRAITKNEGQEGPSVTSYLVMVTLLVLFSYLYVLAIYAPAAAILPGITVERESFRMLGRLAAAAFVGGLLGACAPAALLRIPSSLRFPFALVSLAIPIAVVCLTVGWLVGELGYGLLGSACLLSLNKIAVMRSALCIDLERRHALEVSMTIPVLLELATAFLGLAVAPAIQFS